LEELARLDLPSEYIAEILFRVIKNRLTGKLSLVNVFLLKEAVEEEFEREGKIKRDDGRIVAFPARDEYASKFIKSLTLATEKKVIMPVRRVRVQNLELDLGKLSDEELEKLVMFLVLERERRFEEEKRGRFK